MSSRPGPALTVVAPDSLRTWYRLFAHSQGSVLFVGEHGDHLTDIVDRVSAQAGRPVRILSGHDSLRRDFEVARRLRRRGITVRSQSDPAVRAGTDKVLLKRTLEAHHIAVPAWGIGAPDDAAAGTFLYKRRNSTQSDGIGWVTGTWATDDATYWEEYVQGTEYSIVLYREGGTTSFLPVIWKGHTRRDLLPPWKRLRLIPPPHTAEANIDQMVAISQVIGDALDVWAFAEIEFVVAPDGRVLVLDVNPRICGTLRIAAMASRLAIFDPEVFRGQRFQAIDFAAEAPYDGEAFAAERVVATSRITCSASSAAEVSQRLGRLVGARYDWPEGWL